MQIAFLGAAGTVTGSCFLLDNGILVDMGMFQGNPELESLNYQPLNFDPREIHSVFITHAHLDHIGRLPILINQGFSGRIYMTKATSEIAEVVLMDASKIMQKDKVKPILYTEDTIFDLLKMTDIVDYGEEINLGNTKAVFRDAGHILGSASIEINSQGKKFAFSGDIGNYPEELIAHTEFIKSAEYVIMESTYGDRNHPEDNSETELAEEIKTIIKTQGVLLIPSFSVERTQVILFKINKLKEKKEIPNGLPVYLDSPMGESITKIYKKFIGGDPFSFSGLNIIKSRQDSFKIHSIPGSKVIIAGSGMMTGGRILDHALYYLPIENTILLIVGFQGEGTIGRNLEEGAKSVNIYGQEVKVLARVNSIHSMSAHADKNKLIRWLKEIKGVKKIFLIHGEDGPRNTLKEEIKKLGIEDVNLPNINEIFEL